MKSVPKLHISHIFIIGTGSEFPLMSNISNDAIGK